MSERKAMVETENQHISIRRQCELIDLPRSSFYRDITRVVDCVEIMLMRAIDELYTANPSLGSRRMVRQLRKERDLVVNRKCVRRLMKKMGIESMAPKPDTSRPNKQHKVYPYLLRNLPVTRSNQVWATDITYIRMAGGFVYLVAIVDWFSRKVLSWEVSVTFDAAFCVSALERALRRFGTPEIFNTDQGSHFTSEDFTGVLKNHNVQISMNGKGRALDNIFVERLWRTVKYEEVYLKEYASVRELKTSLGRYFRYYNELRSHSSLNDQTPDEVYAAGMRDKEAA